MLTSLFHVNFLIFSTSTTISFNLIQELQASLSLLTIVLFIMGITIINLNKRNLIISLMGIEIILLSCNVNFIFAAWQNGDGSGFVYTLGVLTISAVETAIGVGILILCYGVNGTIEFSELKKLKD